jgi:diguanylate cyclase (GGDEF)-like protein/PAS domain S-box-containing protein
MDEATDSPSELEGREDDPLAGLRLPPRALLEAIPDAVVAAGPDGRIVFVNQLAEELFGYPREQMIGQPVQMLWAPRVRDAYTRNMELLFATEHDFRLTTVARGLRSDGAEFVGEMSWGLVHTAAGPLLFAVGRDITARRATESRLRAVAALAARALAVGEPATLAAEIVELLRRRLPITHVEVRLRDGTALASWGEALAAPHSVSLGTGDELRVSPTRALDDEEVSVLHAVANILATGLERTLDEQRIRHQAVHDPLTGLANRTLLRDRLEHALARSEREGRPTGVLFIDLDGFKQINDMHGHPAGDAMLIQAADRLRDTVRPADTVARVGGDEFVVVCESVDETTAMALGERLAEALADPVRADGVEHPLSASVGVALGFEGPERLLACADIALYRAKARGRGRVEFFRS